MARAARDALADPVARRVVVADRRPALEGHLQPARADLDGVQRDVEDRRLRALPDQLADHLHGRGAGRHRARELRRLRARALQVPRLRRAVFERDRHAAHPGLVVPAPGVHGLHLAQAEHAHPFVRHPPRDDPRLHGVLHARGDLLHALLLRRDPARSRRGSDGRRLHAVRRLREDRAPRRGAGHPRHLRLRVPVRVGRAPVRRGLDAVQRRDDPRSASATSSATTRKGRPS